MLNFVLKIKGLSTNLDILRLVVADRGHKIGDTSLAWRWDYCGSVHWTPTRHMVYL